MKIYKVRNYTVDKNLGYVIQQVSKDTTPEILAYFYGIAQFVMDDIAKKSKASWLNKNIVLYYKETPIPFRIQISGPGPARYNEDSERDWQVSIEVSFPKEKVYHEVGDLMTSIMESGLGLTEERNMPDFDRPILDSPRCLRNVRIKQDEQRTSKITDTGS